jgi:hypothetical protein
VPLTELTEPAAVAAVLTTLDINLVMAVMVLLLFGMRYKEIM